MHWLPAPLKLSLNTLLWCRLTAGFSIAEQLSEILALCYWDTSCCATCFIAQRAILIITIFNLGCERSKTR